jgi:hypothetical protein
VHILFGTNTGLTATGEQFFNQGDAGGNAQGSDFFGSALAAADFNGDGRADLAIGTPGEDIGVFGAENAGAVNIMYGSAGGITQAGAIELVQDDLANGEASEDGDRFGEVLSAGDFNGNGRADLVIGVPLEDSGVTIINIGRVHVVYGLANGFSGGQGWGQETPGMPDAPEASDAFGGGLDSSGGKSAPQDRYRRGISQLIMADYDFDTPITKLNKRRQMGVWAYDADFPSLRLGAFA